MIKCVFLCADIMDEYHHSQCWEIDGNQAQCINSSYPIGTQNTVSIADGKNLLDTMAAIPEGAPWRIPDKSRFRLEETRMLKGGYFPRIYRDMLGMQDVMSQQVFHRINNQELYATAFAQDKILSKNLDNLCRFIHPVEKNMNSYGHEVRNHLILACTEIEAQFIGILKANNISPINTNYNTNDYAKLLKLMKLDQYSVKLWSYPWLEPIKPFANWSEKQPTKTLSWYSAYHNVKHDRENKFDEATLRNAIEATIACNVIIAAQYGEYSMGSTTYQLLSRPRWKRHELYIPSLQDEENWTPMALNI